MRLIAGLGVGLLAAAAIAPAQASVVVSYPDFTGACGSATLTCVGSAATSGSVLRVTPAITGQSGAAYSTTAITLGASDTFSTQFQFQFTGAGGIDPADGITFVLAANPTGLGVGGGGIGYQGVPNSVAVEFDTFFNGGADSSSNHVAVDVNGVLSNSALFNPYGVSDCNLGNHLQAGCMSNGDIWTVSISYDGTLLNATVQDGSGAVQGAINNLAIDIAGDLGTSSAFVGFTSGTGSGFENHDILNWDFADTTELGHPVPEPSGLALIGFGLAALGFRRGRKG